MNIPGSDLGVELERQRAENARLIALLDSHGIEWRQPPEPTVIVVEPEPSQLSSLEPSKLRLETSKLELKYIALPL